MFSKSEADFLRGHFPLIMTIFGEVNHFAGYVEGAKNADIVIRKADIVIRTGDAVRQAVKWETNIDDNNVLVREERLAFLIREIEALDAPTERLAEITQVTKDLWRKMDCRSGFTTSEHAQQWANYTIPNELQASASRLAHLLEALIVEIMGGQKLPSSPSGTPGDKV